MTYFDGQFDDARLARATLCRRRPSRARRAELRARDRRTTTAGGAADGVVAIDVESGRELRVPARVIVNATGPFADGVRRLALPGAPALIAPSQGIHLVFDRSFLPGACGADGAEDTGWPGDVCRAVARVHAGRHYRHADREVALEPRPLEEEIAFVLETAAPYFEKAPTRGDVLSSFAGIRPLVARDGTASTASLSRDHTVCVEASRLVTITGGKWTTYRRMAEDARRCGRDGCGPAAARLRHQHAPRAWMGPAGGAAGRACACMGATPRTSRRSSVRTRLDVPLHPGVPCTGATVTWAARAEMARTVEDVLARRCRALFLDAAAARTMAPQVAAILARELGRDAAWERQQIGRVHTAGRAVRRSLRRGLSVVA